MANARVINVQKSTFMPVVLSTHGRLAPECQTLFKRAAKLISEKRKERYADVMGYVYFNEIENVSSEKCSAASEGFPGNQPSDKKTIVLGGLQPHPGRICRRRIEE